MPTSFMTTDIENIAGEKISIDGDFSVPIKTHFIQLPYTREKSSYFRCINRT